MNQNIEFPKTHNFKNLTNNVYNKLTVIRYAGIKNGKTAWVCNCECDKDNINRKEIIVKSTHLKSGYTKSCGCLIGKSRIKHGMSKDKIHGIWCSMRERCNDSNNQAYHNYGGRGIKVCDRWLGVDGFQKFYEDMGDRPSSEYTLERRDNNENYCPENCYWATRIEQGRNKRNNVYIEYNGKNQTLSEWARETGFNQTMIARRLKNGWSIEEALTVDSRRKVFRK